MTDVVNPKSASPDQLLPYHKKISAEGKALMICFISYTYMVLKTITITVIIAATEKIFVMYFMFILLCTEIRSLPLLTLAQSPREE